MYPKKETMKEVESIIRPTPQTPLYEPNPSVAVAPSSCPQLCRDLVCALPIACLKQGLELCTLMRNNKKCVHNQTDGHNHNAVYGQSKGRLTKESMLEMF